MLRLDVKLERLHELGAINPTTQRKEGAATPDSKTAAAKKKTRPREAGGYEASD